LPFLPRAAAASPWTVRCLLLPPPRRRARRGNHLGGAGSRRAGAAGAADRRAGVEVVPTASRVGPCS
jgi:hypothetical protein